MDSLGDVELAKRLGLIRKMHLRWEDLRIRDYEAVKYPLEELKRFVHN